MRVLTTSSRNTFALDLVRKLGAVGHTAFASDLTGRTRHRAPDRA